jgi:integrase
VLPSGRYQASYVGRDLTRHVAPTTFTAKMDAEYWLGDERRLIERGEWTPPAQREAESRARVITLDEYAETWIEQRPLKPRTRKMYKDMMRLHISDTLGKVGIGALTGQAVRAWYAKLDPKRARSNSHAYALLHAVCGTAVKDGLLQANPCHIERAMNPQRKREPVMLTVAELAVVADKIRPERLRALVLLSAWCGVRWGEVSELRRKDIDADCEVVYVGRTVTHRSGECSIDTPKSGKPRAVVIPPHIRADVRHHLETFTGTEPDALLFPAGRSGCHLNDRVFRKYLEPALKAVDREDARVHDMRHFAGTQVARVGNLVETMHRLGHSTVKASLLYQQVVSGRDAEIAAALSALATGKADADAEPSAELTTR